MSNYLFWEFKLFRYIYIIFAFLLLSFNSCDGGHQKLPTTLLAHLSGEPATLNPITATDSFASSINKYIYETLLERDKDSLELIPQLAKKWIISKDKKKYRFYLKKGVFWSDGVEFTGDDIVYSFNRIKDPKVDCTPLKGYYVDIEKITKIDKYTVEFKYKKPYFLALEIVGSLPIVPKHIFDNKTDFNSHKNNRFPIGTGPFKFERWETGKRIILVRNEKYRGVKPELKKIIYKVVMESNVALQMLKKGDLDLMGLRPIQWERQTKSEKFSNKFYKLKYYTPNYSYIGWNSKSKFFSDSKVRVAMTHLVNRREILKKLNFGLGKLVTGNFYISSSYYNKDIIPYEYNVEKAKKLLEEAGWTDSNGDGVLDKDGVDFNFVFTISAGNPFSERLATIIQENFLKVGIKMEVIRYEWAVFLGKIHRKEFDAVRLGWSLGYGGDPYQLWHSSQIKSGSNYCAFSNKEADDIIETGRTEYSLKKRSKMFKRFHEILHVVQPYTFLYCSPSLVVVSKKFKNVKVHTTGLNYLEWKIKE